MHARLALAALALCGHGLAQSADGPYWSERPLPANVSSIVAVGSLVVVQTPTAVEVFSAVLRTWTSIPVGGAAVVHSGNNLCVVEDSGALHACAAHASGYATLQPAGGHVLSLAVDGTVCLVRDGSTVHACSGFFGQWVALTLSGTPRFTRVDGNVAFTADDTAAHAFSGLFNVWRSTPSRANARYTAGKNCAVAVLTLPDEVKAFSAYRDRWSTQTVPTTNVTASVADGYAFVVGGPSLLAFSALRGAFTSFAGGGQPIRVQVMAANVAVLEHASGDFAYDPGHNQFVSGWITAHTPSAFHLWRGEATSSFVSHVDPTTVAFSAVRGTFSSPAAGAYGWTVGDHVAFGNDTLSATPAHVAYSSVLGTWSTLPAVTVTRAHPTPESIVLETPTGLVGFSARTGTFAQLALTPTAIATRPENSIVAVADAGRVAVFDPVLGRWKQIATTGSVTASTLAVVGVTALATDAARAHGYSLFTNTWDSIALQGAAVAQGTGREAGYVSTATHLYVFTAHGSMSDTSRHPELSRVAVLGMPLNFVQTAPPGAAVVMLLGVGQTELPVAPFGTLRVDPSAMATLPVGVVPAAGALRFALPLPSVGTIGSTIVVQDVVLTLPGRLYLTNGRVLIPW